MKFHIRIIYSFLILLNFSVCYSATNYYISSVNGNDNNNGTSSGFAWKTITRLQTAIPNLRPGDKIYFERGSVWYNSSLSMTGVNGTLSAPIVFSAYGSGAAPIICGSTKVQSLQQNGNIWTKYDGSFPVLSADIQNIAGLYINDNFYAPGRTPNAGFYTTLTKGTKTLISDPDFNWSTNQWQGGQVVARTVSWSYDKSYISSSSVNSLSLNGLTYNLKYDTTFYFIQNHINTLDQNFEWAYSNKTLSIYSTINLNQQLVEIPVVENILVISDCENILFENLQFSKANLAAFKISESNSITINNCRIKFAGLTGIKLYRTSNFRLTNSVLEDCFSNSVLLDESGLTTIENNKFRRCGIIPGISNSNYRGRSTISSYVAQETLLVQYNRFDSVMIAYQGHYSHCPMYFQYNIIDDYGMLLGDYGAIYLEGESQSTYKKYVKNNIILNGHADLESILGRGIGDLPHAIYLDYDCSNIEIDSNTIINSNYAIHFNRVRNNVVKNNTIVNPGIYMNDDWKSAVLWNQNIGLLFDYLDFNSFSNNLVVLNDNASYGFILHDVVIGSNTMNYNTYIQPFKANGDIVRKVSNYGNFWEYNISDWNAISGQEGNSTYGNSVTKYSASLGISQDQFIKTCYNNTKRTAYQPLGASYADAYGNNYDGGVNIRPYSSKILFYKGASTYQNQTPQIQNQTYSILEQTTIPSYVCKVIASDPDAGQTLSFSILSGNDNNIFRINASTGDIYLNVFQLDFENISAYSLTVRVSDNGVPVKTNQALITINLISDPTNYTPVINDQNFEIEHQGVLPNYIGQLVASDENTGQSLTYEIFEGNTAGYFILYSSGALYFNTQDEIADGVYDFRVRVSDNGTPSLSDIAQITITLDNTGVNSTPLIEAQDFIFIEKEEEGAVIGKVIATDPNRDRLTYSLVSGETTDLSIDEHTGVISFNSNKIIYTTKTTLNFEVRVTDDGTPALSSIAQIEIEIYPEENVVYIDPSSTIAGNGTFLFPFQSLATVLFQENKAYLIKSGTTSIFSEPINITVDNIIISTYGEGAKPIFTFTYEECFFKSVDRKNIIIENIYFNPVNGLSCIYVLGPLTSDFHIKNCEFENTEYGLRIINTNNVLVQFCKFSNHTTGVFAVTSSVMINYNIFFENENAIDLSSVSQNAGLHNNVFYNNRQALFNKGNQMEIINNIFYQSMSSDKALSSVTGYTGNYNIFYPETDNYYTVGDFSYSNIASIREQQSQELNSLIGDPQFVNANMNDFHLSLTSPAIDAGTYIGLIKDIEGNAIPYGHAPDMGALESNDFIDIPEQPLTEYNDLIVYPNPAEEQIFIQTDKSWDINKTIIQLVDITGNMIYSAKTNSYFADNTIKLSTDNFFPGIYVLRVISNDQIYTKKVIFR